MSSSQIHRNAIRVSLAIYLVATWSTMAGMEIFGWLTFLLTATYAFRAAPDEKLRIKDFDAYLPWKACLILFVITILGNFVNGLPESDKVFSIGSQRWFLLFFTGSFALALWPPTPRGYKFFLVFSSIIAIYAVSQAFTGYDILRPGSNRSVWAIVTREDFKLWRSAGLFGSPLQYGYNAGMYASIALAAAVLSFHERKSKGWFFWGSAIAFVLIATSLVTTFTRGTWIAMIASWIVVAWVAAPRIAATMAGAITAIFAVLFFSFETIRDRVLTLFDLKYFSNYERLGLWKVNIQMFKDYPILGIGYQQNEVRSGEYLARMGDPGGFTGHAHNNYLQMLAGTGITGFVTYMVLITFMLWLTWRLWQRLPQDLLWARTIVLGALGAQVLLHVGGMTECNFKTGTTNHNFMVVWALVVSMSVLDAKGLLRQRYDVKI